MTPERFSTLTRALQKRQPDLTVIAEDAQKSRNIAALVRTCDAVGVMEVHTISANDVRRHRMVAAGSNKWVPLRRHKTARDACGLLQKQGFSIVAAHQSRHAVDFREVDYTRPTAILLGSETWGVSATAASLADHHVTVPMLGMVASLNVSVAAALVLYEAMRQRQAAGLYETTRLDAQTYEKILFEWAYPRIARYCRERSIPYPTLDNNGDLAGTPLSDAGSDNIDTQTTLRYRHGNSKLEKHGNRRK